MFSWFPDQAQDVIVLDKNDLTKRRLYELPPGFQFHFGNAYEENGDIIYSACVGDDGFVVTGAKDVLAGRVPERAGTKLNTVRLSKDGMAKVTREISELAEHEFPQFNPLYKGRRAQYLYTIGKIVEEHLFVPRTSQKSEDDGYLVGTSLDFKSKHTQLNILDAGNISNGPIAVLELPYHLPLGFHGAWVNAG